MTPRSGLRMRLVWIVLFAVLPVFGVSIYGSLQDQAEDIEQARTALQGASSAQATALARTAETVRQLLVAISQVPQVREGSREACQAYLDQMREIVPAYNNFGVIDTDGAMRCNTLSRNRVSVGTDRAYFHGVIASGQFSVGDYAIGTLSGRPVLGFGYPIRDAAGRLAGVSFASLKLEDLQRDLQNLPLPPEARITVLDRNARVLATTDGRYAAGAVIANPALAELVRTGQPSLREVPDPADGTPHMHAFQPAPGAAQGALFVAVSMDRAGVVAPGRERLVTEVTLLAVVALLGAILAWIYAGRAIVRPAHAILDATASLQGGDLHTRLPERASAGTEFERIGHGLNRMAQALAEREQALREAAAQRERLVEGNAQRMERLVAAQIELADANLSVPDMMDRMASMALRVTGAPGAEFELADGGEFVLRSGAGISRRPIGVRRPVGALALEVLTQLRTLRCDNTELDPRVDRALAREYGVRSLVMSAVRIAGKPSGCLFLISERADTFVDSDVRALESLCEFLGAMLHRKQVEQSLWSSEQRYAALFDAAPLPMAVFDASSMQFLAVNEAMARAYGFSREELLAMNAYDIRPVRDHEQMRQSARQGYARQPSIRAHRRRDGSEFFAQTLTSEVNYGGVAARFAVSLDVSDQVKAERAVTEHVYTLQRAADAAQAIVSHHTLHDTLREVADQLRGVIGAHCAIVTVTQGKGRDEASVTSPPDCDAPLRERLRTPGADALRALVRGSNRRMRLTQAQLLAHPLHRAGDPAMDGWLAVPLVARDGRNIGLMELSERQAGDFTLQDEYVAIELAQLASAAIENARLFDEVQQLNRDLEHMVEERSLALARQEAVFRTVAQQAPLVMWIVNPKGAVTYLNQAWYELVGGEAPKWQGHEWADAVDPEDVAEMRARWQVCLVDNSVFSGQRRVRAHDGTIHTLAYRASPVYDARGEVMCWVGLDADITEIKGIENALRIANQELEAFSYSVSHDLRAPLNTIDGFSRVLESELKDHTAGKVQHYLSRIHAATGQMEQLIDGLLSLAQISRQALHRARVDLAALAGDILERLRRQEPAREVAFEVQGSMHAEGDARLLRALLENLLGNAWKFTSHTPQARIAVGCIADGARAPVYFVRDNGAGFNPQYAGKLFGAFQRLHSQAEFPGTGIGLATVRRIVTRHGGRVWAESAEGQGATFFFTLNAADALEAPAPSPAPALGRG